MRCSNHRNNSDSSRTVQQTIIAHGNPYVSLLLEEWRVSIIIKHICKRVIPFCILNYFVCILLANSNDSNSKLKQKYEDLAAFVHSLSPQGLCKSGSKTLFKLSIYFHSTHSHSNKAFGSNSSHVNTDSIWEAVEQMSPQRFTDAVRIEQLTNI